jgi:hypothetical protein
MHRLLTTLLVLVISGVSASAQSLPVPSYWKNQRGSEMKLYEMATDGTFKGIYINHAARTHCQNTPYDVHGTAIGRHVKFSVVWKNWWEDCKSTAVWHGRVTGKTITTWWLLRIYNDDGTVSKVRGIDIFQQQP